jgi:DNA-binding response OmpR family regulator
VLVVEDDIVVASAMRMLFERRGWEVLLAGNLAQAQNRLDPPPQWIVLDLMLPDGDGVELLREVQRRGLATRAVVTTGVAEPNHLRAVREFHPAAILHKPTSFSRILDAMGAGAKDQVMT